MFACEKIEALFPYSGFRRRNTFGLHLNFSIMTGIEELQFQQFDSEKHVNIGVASVLLLVIARLSFSGASLVT